VRGQSSSMVHKSWQRTFISLHKEKDWAIKVEKGSYREMEKRDALKGDKLGLERVVSESIHRTREHDRGKNKSQHTSNRSKIPVVNASTLRRLAG
jgi:hypothetical protein